MSPPLNAWTLASISKARREHVVAALRLRAYLRAFVPYWEAAPYAAKIRQHLAAARRYRVR